MNTEFLPHWDLTDLYSDINCAEIEYDFEDLEKLSIQFEWEFKDGLSQISGKMFGETIQHYEKMCELIGKLEAYAYMKHSISINDIDVTNFYQKVQETNNKLLSKLLFFRLEVNKLSDDCLNQKMSDPVVQKYKSWIENIRKYKDHQLDERLEKMLLDKSISGANGWVRLYDETMSKLRFKIDDVLYTETEALNLLLSDDYKLRQKVGEEFKRIFTENISLFSLITNTLAKDKQIEDEWRGFSNPMSDRNLGNQVEDSVVDALVQSVEEKQPKISHRYYSLKSKWLKLDRITYWDRNAPIPFLEEREYTWEDAKNIVYHAYNEFSPEMAEIGKKFFENSWIDVPPAEGKEGGAYAHPVVPSVHPYIMLNYMGKTDDIMTLAHELGHGIHQYLARKQGYLLSDTPLTLAETASVFGEMLTFKYMLKIEQNPHIKFKMLAEKVGSMLNTSVRQIAFHKFEMEVHTRRRICGELSPNELNEIWKKTQQDALGPAVNIDDGAALMWCGIPHLIHTPFYVYSYAFGDCLVNTLYNVYENNLVENFQDKYIEMLSKGGSQRHKELLAPFNLDASQANFWKKGLSVVEHFVDELELLTKELNLE